jgi:hypothetical protein
MTTGGAHPQRGLDLGYARVSTTKQCLERQLDTVDAAGIPDERIFTDKKTGATVDREGLSEWLIDVGADPGSGTNCVVGSLINDGVMRTRRWVFEVGSLVTMARRLVGLLCVALLCALAGCGLGDGVDGDLTNGWPRLPAPAAFRPRTGVCFDDVSDVSPQASYAPFGCAQRHVAETYYVGDLTGSPSDSVAAQQAYAQCSARATAFVGGPWRAGRLVVQQVLPGPKGWHRGARWFRCDIAELDFSTGDPVSRTGSLKGALTGAAPTKLRCFDPRVSGQEVRGMKAVACDRAHHAEFAGLWQAPRADAKLTTGDPRLEKGCLSTIARFAGVPDDANLRYRVGWLAFVPDDKWGLGERAVQCFLWLDGQPVKGSYVGAGTAKLPINYG